MTVIVFGIVSVEVGLCSSHEAYVTYVNIMYLANDITAMTLSVKAI